MTKSGITWNIYRCNQHQGFLGIAFNWAKQQSLKRSLTFLKLMMEVNLEFLFTKIILYFLSLVKHKYKHLGYGMCRGAKWTDRVWPIMRGPRSLQECANSCGRTKGCIAFDVSGGQSSGKPDCMLYGHRHPVPAPGVPGDCYTIPGAVFIEEVHPEEDEVGSRRAAILNEDQEEETNIGTN